MKLRVGIETSVTEVTKGGTSVYIKELFNALKSINTVDEFVEIKYNQKLNRNNKLSRVLDTIHRDIAWTFLLLKSKVKNGSIDILHCPFPWAPLDLRCRLVVTALDASQYRYPQNMTHWMSFSQKIMIPKVLIRADKIVAISNFTKNEYLELFPWLREDKIIVTHLGVNSKFRIIEKNNLDDIKSKYSLSSKFILSVCTIEPRKNLKRLLQAFSLVKDKIEHNLVLAGAYGWKNKELYSLIYSLGISSRVKFTGHISLNDLVKLYNMADLFAYVSIYEGFGIPPLEAMACGCPVITSNNTSIPEIVGDAAYQVNPFDIEEISVALEKMASDAQLRNRFTKLGLQQVQKFSWSKCAVETLRVYHSLS